MSGIRIRDSRVLVTGAGSGIGRAIAVRSASEGAEVVAVDIDADTAAETAEMCRREAIDASSYVCDVSSHDAVEELAEAVEAERGAIDVAVNNAGVGLYGHFLDGAPEDWDWLMGVNLDGVVNGCRAFGGRMVARQSGHLVNIASGAGYIPNRNMAAYCTSKAAVVMLSQCLRGDWSTSGVGVSVICPGVIATPIARNTRMSSAAESKRGRAVGMLGRGHSPDVVAKAVVSAVEKNRELVPAGIESTAAYHLMRLTPARVRGLIARSELP